MIHFFFLLKKWKNWQDHNGTFFGLFRPWVVALRHVADYKRARESFLNVNMNTYHWIDIYWKPLRSSLVKIKTDGAVKGVGGSTSCGDRFRDEAGKWLGGFSHYLGTTIAYLSEFWGVLDGLTLVKAKGYTHADSVIKTGSDRVVQPVNPKIGRMTSSSCTLDRTSM